ncbi:succinate dehydrogenase/fumarate reductase cytochrome b subunit [Solidesulfovibrio sp.]|uniref:succinate dehydrogenase/fumarate reductase cytochrome b subunit n=1 Tax=Solidesulfovibrio sp. TaxID=2910990 RepID=UPI002B20ECD7|nr:succinate dehydrogenase/fumarate reductase cytochrome b subunit [Solidesulfovibrio sp.]MEA4858632.1 succinate dehydrogenase/fumarate reductase cytochrome b subunit [Solidesulfovibrio sp.]
MSVPSTATHAGLPVGKLSAYLDWLQMLTGAALIAFMWCHLILVSSILLGPGVMNALAWFFEATYMAQVGGPLIFLAFLLHFVLAARKIPFATGQQRLMLSNAKRLRHPDTWLWIVQATTAMGILILGAVHMWVVLTNLPITAEKSAARIQTGFWFVFYLFLLPMVELHVGIGFYRILVKWGFLDRQGRWSIKKKENLLTGIFIAIGLLSLLRYYFLSLK